MAQARGILLWLPLQRLLRFNLLTPELARERLSALNQVSLQTFEASRLQLQPKLTEVDHYVRLCTHQGELSSQASLYVNPADLLLRTLALGDLALYEEFINQADPRELAGTALMQACLETGNRRVQALILARRFSSQLLVGIERGLNTLLDPEGIAWTAGLKNFFTQAHGSQFSLAADRDQFIAGYLQTVSLPQALAHPSPNFASGWLAAELGKYPFAQQPFLPEVDLYLRQQQDTERWAVIFRAGYVPNPATIALPPQALDEYLNAIRPGAFYQAFRLFPRAFSPALPANFPLKVITDNLVLRARAMLATLTHLGLDSVPQIVVYRRWYRVICGQPISAEELSGPNTASIVRTMLAVAHPNLTADLLQRWYLPTDTLSVSLVKYDLPNLERIAPGHTSTQVLVKYGALPLTADLKSQPEDLSWRPLTWFGKASRSSYPEPASITPVLLEKIRSYGWRLPASRSLINTSDIEPVMAALNFTEIGRKEDRRKAQKFQEMVAEREDRLAK